MKTKFIALVVMAGLFVGCCPQKSEAACRRKGRAKAAAARVLRLTHKLVHRHHDHGKAHSGACATCK